MGSLLSFRLFARFVYLVLVVRIWHRCRTDFLWRRTWTRRRRGSDGPPRWPGGKKTTPTMSCRNPIPSKTIASVTVHVLVYFSMYSYGQRPNNAAKHDTTYPSRGSCTQMHFVSVASPFCLNACSCIHTP